MSTSPALKPDSGKSQVRVASSYFSISRENETRCCQGGAEVGPPLVVFEIPVAGQARQAAPADEPGLWAD